MKHGQTLSMRGLSNVASIMPKIAGAVKDRSSLQIDSNPNIDLSTAENWLLRPELIQICKDAIANSLCAQDLSYPRAFAGFPEVLDAFTLFFNNHFAPILPVEVAHLATAPGAASCFDTLLYNICDPGDGILIPSLYWSGFDFQFKARSSVTPVIVPIDDFELSLTKALIPALEAAFESASCPVRGLMIANPHNPLGQCYTRECIELCIAFCGRKGIHYLSDEVYALTSFPCLDIPTPRPFVSALSIDIPKVRGNPALVHTFWSTSKDFGQSGVRMGCTVTQANPEMAVGLALASNTQTSTLSSIFVSALLSSSKIPQLLKLNSERLAAAYGALSDVLKKHNIPYIPCDAGLYVFAKIAPNAVSWEDESSIVQALKDGGVIVSAGRGYHGPESEKGWARIGFAVEETKFREAIRRIDGVLTRRGSIRVEGNKEAQ